jgi:hypothetical protein
MVDALQKVREKIRRNMPETFTPDAPKRQSTVLCWKRERATSMISTDEHYRITKVQVGPLFAYHLWQVSEPNTSAVYLAGPYGTSDEAKANAQRHRDGEPVQKPLR